MRSELTNVVIAIRRSEFNPCGVDEREKGDDKRGMRGRYWLSEEDEIDPEK